MRWGIRLLSFSRPFTMVMVIGLNLALYGVGTPQVALLALGAAFFVATSAVLVGWVPVSTRWHAPILWGELAVVTGLNWMMTPLQPGGSMQILYMPVAVTVFTALQQHFWKGTMAVTVLLWLASSATGLYAGSVGIGVVATAIYGALLVFSASSGYLVRSLWDERERTTRLLARVEQSQATLERTHRQLQDSLASQQEMAVLEERQRLARDIHDGVAHTLTALVVQIQAGRRLLDREPGRAAEIIGHCEEMAREAVQETRRAVRALHPAGLEQASLPEALRRLARDFSMATGITVTVNAGDAVDRLPPNPKRLEQLYRIFQEALTNAHRHGQASRVTADLQVTAGRLSLAIDNDGSAPCCLEPGVGLASMQERAHSLGGTVTMDPGGVGLSIRVMAPVAVEQEVRR